MCFKYSKYIVYFKYIAALNQDDPCKNVFKKTYSLSKKRNNNLDNVPSLNEKLCILQYFPQAKSPRFYFDFFSSLQSDESENVTETHDRREARLITSGRDVYVLERTERVE